MRQENKLTMILKHVEEVNWLETNGCVMFANLLGTEEYYRIFESNREHQYFMMLPTLPIMFYMNEEDLELGECYFDINRIDGNDEIACTLYTEERYHAIQEEQEESKQYSLHPLCPIMAK